LDNRCDLLAIGTNILDRSCPNLSGDTRKTLNPLKLAANSPIDKGVPRETRRDAEIYKTIRIRQDFRVSARKLEHANGSRVIRDYAVATAAKDKRRQTRYTDLPERR
jgi:hypothetical protein